MRLWSLHPTYLDSSGLVACWREGLLARHVLLGLTKGYVHHPQLIRFKELENPVIAIDTYLQAILEESKVRGFSFDKTKIFAYDHSLKIIVTDKQLTYEFEHLKKKLKTRNPDYYQRLISIIDIQPHPMFCKQSGEIASWEIIS